MGTTYDDIEFVSASARAVDFAGEWYDIASEDHFWFEWRFNVLMRSIRDLDVSTSDPLRVMDIGCGTGVLIQQLEHTTHWSIDGVDLNLSSLRKAEIGRGRRLFYDVREERREYLEAYDIVVLFDVIEHVPDDRGLVLSSIRHLKRGGLVMINVPALSLLMGAYDVATGHLRRYEESSLKKILNGVPVEVKIIRFWGFCLVPLLFLRNAILRRPKSAARTIESGFRPPNRTVDRVLRMLMRLETGLLDRVPLGASLMLIGSRI